MTAVAAWLWQGLLLVAVIDLLLRAVPRLNAATRHLAWWAALAGLFLLALVHSGRAAVVSNAVSTTSLPAPVGGLLVLPSAPGWLPPLAVALWVVLALRGVVRVVSGLRRVAALRRETTPLDGSRLRRLVRWAAAAHRRAATVCVTPAPIGACALGFRRPTILVSAHLAAALDDDLLDQVVLHEQAHVDRYDDWLRVAQSLAMALLWVHPAAHVISRRIDLEREAACDDLVVSVTGAADAYAACLTEAAAATSPRLPVAVPTVLGSGGSAAGSLRRRIVRLLDSRPDRGHRFVRPVVAATTIAVAAIVAAAPLMPALIVFVERAAPPGRLDAGRVFLPRGGAPAPSLAASSVMPTTGRAPVPVPSSLVASRRLSPPALVRPSAVASSPLPEATAVATQDQAAEPLPRDAHQSLDATAYDVPVDTLGSMGLPLTDAPPAAAVGPQRAEASAARNASSFTDGLSQLGRDSAANARRSGLSVAGTFARAGKAIGKFF